MIKTRKSQSQKMVIYQTKTGAIELREDVRADTLWATQAQIASAFNVDVRTSNKHVQKISIHQTNERQNKLSGNFG